MKKTIIFASVALATLFAFSSCQKENLENNYSENNVRVITATFENNGTKTTLSTEDNKTPLWKEGDIIRVLNATVFEDITLTADNIKNDGKSITFTTTLTGTLYAVYPASATAMTSCSGSIAFTIPAVQDGTFASANICVAKSMEDDETNKDNLVFSNATSVLEFSQTAATTQVLSVRVEAANAIAGPMTVNYKSDGTFDTPTTSSLSGKLIRVKSATAVDKYYIAVAPVATGKIEFEYQKAVEVATVTTEAGKTLAANTIYTCSMDGQTYGIKEGSINGHDYVQVGSVKWATKNIGATAPTGADSYGDLFSWGDVATKGNYGKSSYGSPAKDIATNIAPDSGYDVARVKWGGTWRMPTGNEGEFNALKKATYWKWEDSGYYVYVPQTGDAGKINNKSSNTYNKSDALLFFPAAGSCAASSTSPSGGGTTGYYWSSTWNSSGNAYRLTFDSTSVSPQSNSTRFCGYSVRPVSD